MTHRTPSVCVTIIINGIIVNVYTLQDKLQGHNSTQIMHRFLEIFVNWKLLMFEVKYFVKNHKPITWYKLN